ncbi:hypothetical protein P280DRAFT_541312 [Massarina eburnea CBS 473.64]|uniref:Uncharacterized protein n=1 Tax=Massarina eburnea CBS 473.64 TaxID=1395130 RepID=A0A6A6S2V3_9PLEO|nr:hypothetical protein P280DRAFT_541312 [Massarina eburnea CBS 473.64]
MSIKPTLERPLRITITVAIVPALALSIPASFVCENYLYGFVGLVFSLFIAIFYLVRGRRNLKVKSVSLEDKQSMEQSRLFRVDIASPEFLRVFDRFVVWIDLPGSYRYRETMSDRTVWSGPLKFAILLAFYRILQSSVTLD